MSTAIAENLKNILVKTFPSHATVFTVMKEVYKRTTITPFETQKSRILTKRTGIVDTFKVFTQQLLPQMEKTVELNLLQNLFSQIRDERAKESILQAYHKRNLARLAYSRLQSDYMYYPPDVVAAEISEPLNIFIDVDFNEHNAEDVARYVKFTNEEMEKFFPKDCFGTYKTFEYDHSKTFGVMATEEGLTIVNYLRGIMLDYKNFDYSVLLDSQKVRAALKDEEIYPRIYHLFSNEFIEAIRPYRKSLLFQKLFHTSPIFDAIVNVMVQQVIKKEFAEFLLNPETRPGLFAQLAHFIEQNADHSNPNPLEVPYFMKVLGVCEFQLPGGKTYRLDFKKCQKLYKKFPSTISRFGFNGFHGINSGVFLHGDPGAGKSGTMLYVSMWAHKMGWIVVSVPSVEKWTQNAELGLKSHLASGLFIQQEYAVEFLEQFKSANLELIKNIPVNLDLYGKYNGVGCHENEPEPAPNLYDPERKVFLKDYERFISPEEKALRNKADLEFEPPMCKHLIAPKSLLQIVNFGIDNPIYSTNSIYELLEQLYNLESHHVLVCVDSYNMLFYPSIFQSFRYENDKYLRGRIPPYHLALCRAFINFDGHKIKNGFKVCAAGIPEKFFRQKFNPDMIFFPKGYQKEMKGLLLDDYRNMLSYYHHVKIWRPSIIEDYFSHEWLWMQTQGNWLQTLKILLKCADQ